MNQNKEGYVCTSDLTNALSDIAEDLDTKSSSFRDWQNTKKNLRE